MFQKSLLNNFLYYIIMKYDIKILPLTKLNLEKFDDSNNGYNEHFIDLGLKKNYNMYIEDLYKNIRTVEYFNNTPIPTKLGDNVGGFRQDYTVDWLDDNKMLDEIIREKYSKSSVKFHIQESKGGSDASTALGSFGGNSDAIQNAVLAGKLNERNGSYEVDDYKTDRGNSYIKDPYIDGAEFSFIYSMLKMRMGTVLMGPEGYKQYILDMNERESGEDLDPNELIDDAAIERAMNISLHSMGQLIGKPNKQYDGVAGANLAANMGAGIFTNHPIFSNYFTNPRFEFTIQDPTGVNKDHKWSQGLTVGTNPPWGRDCEDGWDWGSCSCKTVCTDVINASMSIWDTFNTNDCDYFGRDKFDPHFSKKYPEGRYYCDSSIHQLRVYCPNKDKPREEFAGAVNQKLFCDDDTPEIDKIISEKKGNPNWCETNPNAIKHQTCAEEDKTTARSTSSKKLRKYSEHCDSLNKIPDNGHTTTIKDHKCTSYIIDEEDGKAKASLQINYGEVGFSANENYRDKNYPVPPIIHYNGSADHPGMGDTYENECKDDQNRTPIRSEVGNHLFYKYSENTDKCLTIDDKKCNPCFKVSAEECKNNLKYGMCQYVNGKYVNGKYVNGKCSPKEDYKIDFTNTDNPDGSFFDASFKIGESLYKYNRGGNEKTHHPRYNQYAKYIDCRRHGLDDFQCFNPHTMSHLEKWCDALGIDDGYESWNDKSFGSDYRYNIMKIDMIPDAFTDYTIMDYNNLDEYGNPTRKYKANWIGLQKPRALGYSLYEIAPWEKAFGGFHGHTDAMPGGNYAETNLNDEIDRLLFLNRGYCPTRFYEDGAGRLASRGLNNYDDSIGFGYGPYSPHSHLASGRLEGDLSNGVESIPCTWLNQRVKEHTKVLSQWLSDHNTYHKINPSFGLMNEGIVGSSKCNLSKVNDAINRFELCRRYGIGGAEMGQIYFTDPEFIYNEKDRVCSEHSEETACNESNICEIENGECGSNVGASIRRNHGSHLFQRCNANTIMDFENICQRLNIPLYTTNSTKFFNTYKCNTRDVVRRFKYCVSKGVDVSRGEVCDERLIQAQAMNTINQGLMMQISRNTFYSLVLNSITQNRHEAIKALEQSQEIELDIQKAQNQDLLAATRTIASLEQDIMNTINQTNRKESYLKKAQEARLCVLWNIGNSEQSALKNQSIIRDPFNNAIDITSKKKRISEINNKCNSYKEPFPKKIVYGFAFIILIILIFVFFKA